MNRVFPAESHGHILQRADGRMVRCGGPSVCGCCQDEQAWVAAGLALLGDLAAAVGTVLATNGIPAGTLTACLEADLIGRLAGRFPSDFPRGR